MDEGLHIVVGQLPPGVPTEKAALQQFEYGDVANADIFIAVAEDDQATVLKHRWGNPSDVSVDVVMHGSRV